MIKTHTPNHKQEGMALLAVLVIVIVVTLLGVTAMRMSITSLALATNSQVSNLLFQASDAGIRSFASNITNVTAAMDGAGILNPLGSGSNERALCVSTDGATWGSGIHSVNGFRNGNCAVGNASNFVSARNLVVTQLNYVRMEKSGSQVNNGETDLTKTEILDETQYIVTSTSIMPGLGSASIDTINSCLSGTHSSMTGMVSEDTATAFQKGKLSADITGADVVTITDCLTDSGAVFTSHQQVFAVGYRTTP